MANFSMQPPSDRPDPDLLLARVKADEDRRNRAVLKVFLGYAPGVGKTYSMLLAAKRLASQGVDVVVGCVETHGRAETAALMDGLSVLPRREVIHRGASLFEFDLDTALARRPQVLLLDELAHTNAPQSRHPKRWQDVLELLDAGIEVHTTVNIQHLESLNDVVAQITGVKVRETLPDHVLDRADAIEIIDLTPDELLVRLKEGKVYLPETAQRAAENFFKRGNLLALRELALRRAAERLDTDVREYRTRHGVTATWPTAERILVCVGASPSSECVIRGARRMAAGLRAPFTAIYADAPDAYPLREPDRRRLESHLLLAESLGADTARVSGNRVGDEILRYARLHNVTRIVIGKPLRRRLREVFKGSLVDELVRESGEIEVHFISGGPCEGVPENSPAPAKPALRPAPYAAASALVALAAVLSVIGRNFLALPDLVMLHLSAIMGAAFIFGRGPSLLAAALSVAAYDFFSVPPYHTFNVEHARHILTFAMMFAVGLSISGLTSRIRRQEHEAKKREERTAALYALSRDLVAVRDEDEAARITARHAAEVFGGRAAMLLSEASGAFFVAAKSPMDFAISDEELAVVRWAAEQARSAGRGTDTFPGAKLTAIPLVFGSITPGVLAMWEIAPETLTVDRRAFLEAFVSQAALALSRARLSEEAKSAALKARTEEMRSSLLSAASHDLRTPLAAITGLSTLLRDEGGRLCESRKSEMLNSICTEAERMERLVGNLLDMVKLESGGMKPKNEWTPLEEIVGSALSRMEKRLGGRAITVNLAPDFPLVNVDPVLFEQVFVNILDNAAKYTPPESPIEISAAHGEGFFTVSMADSGPGLGEEQEERVFEKFLRGSHPGVGGVGLGLAICRGIVAAHQGVITARNRPEGGSVLTVRLPLSEPPPTKLPDGLEGGQE